MLRLLDTNAVLRYVLNDVPEQSDLVRDVVAAGAETTPEALCECVYVLTGSYYAFDKGSVCAALLLALDDIDCEHMLVMRRALQLHAANRVDFVDCIFAARSEIENADVLTFDKRLQRLIASMNL